MKQKEIVADMVAQVYKSKIAILALLVLLFIECNSKKSKEEPKSEEKTTNLVVDPPQKIPTLVESDEIVDNYYIPTESSTQYEDKQLSDMLSTMFGKPNKDLMNITANVGVKINFNKAEYNASGVIKWERDKIFWMSVSFLGFEVARLKLTKDSVYFINKFQKSYLVDKTERIKKVLGYPLDLNEMQQFFLGVIYIEKDQMPIANLSDDGDNKVLKFRAQKKGYKYKYTLKKENNYEVSDINAISFDGLHIMLAKVGDYKNFDKYRIPQKVNFTFNSSRILNIKIKSLDHNSPKALEYPFTNNFSNYRKL